jgi:hypothetical protein
VVFCHGIAPRIGTEQEYQQKRAAREETYPQLHPEVEYAGVCDDRHRNYLRLRSFTGEPLLSADCPEEGCTKRARLTVLPEDLEQRRLVISKIAMENSGYSLPDPKEPRSPELDAAISAAYRNAMAQEMARQERDLGIPSGLLNFPPGRFSKKEWRFDPESLVVDDITKRAMQKRIGKGIDRYLGKSPDPEPQPVSDPLRDAYEQALDLAISLRQLLKERDAK